MTANLAFQTNSCVAPVKTTDVVDPTLAIPHAPDLRSSKIVVIDDEPINIRVAQKYLKDLGYPNSRGFSSPEEGLEHILKEGADLVLLDVMMPRLSGAEILTRVRSDQVISQLPVIILSASCERETRLDMMERGATDFLTKPIDPCELSPRVRNVLTAKKYNDQLCDQAQLLEAAVRVRTAELEASRRDLIHCLARAAEFRDDTTGHHVIRVGHYAGIIAQTLGWTADAVERLTCAAQLHDIGKIGVPDAILLNPGKLDPEQYEWMQRHVNYGKRIIERMPDQEWDSLKHHAQIGAKILELPDCDLLQMASRIALTHHEKWDGTGYPLGLAGEEIPVEGRIVAVADVFDALSTKRPYKAAFPIETCFNMIEERRGRHFDPDVVDAFLRSRQEILDVQIRFADQD